MIKFSRIALDNNTHKSHLMWFIGVKKLFSGTFYGFYPFGNNTLYYHFGFLKLFQLTLLKYAVYYTGYTVILKPVSPKKML